MATLKKYLFLSAEGSLCVRSDAKSSSHSPLEDFVGEAISLPLFSGGASPSPTEILTELRFYLVGAFFERPRANTVRPYGQAKHLLAPQLKFPIYR